jgi:hypothetical protein
MNQNIFVNKLKTDFRGTDFMSRLSIVMFHEPCIDGAMSAYIVHKYFLSNGFEISNYKKKEFTIGNKSFNYVSILYHKGPIHQNIFYIGVEASDEKLVILNAIIDKYTGEIPHNISPDNRTILILDTSIPYDLIKNNKIISSNVGEIKILDHHSTTSENYGKLNKFTIKSNGQLITNYLYLDEKLSGTTLTYKALFDGRVPYLLKMIEKNDTGKWDIFSSLYAFYEMKFKCNTFLRRLNFMDSIQGNLNIYDNSPEKLLELFTPELIINFVINGIYIKHIALRASRLIELNFLHNDGTYLYDRGEDNKYDQKKLFIINSPYLYGPVANTCNST